VRARSVPSVIPPRNRFSPPFFAQSPSLVNATFDHATFLTLGILVQSSLFGRVCFLDCPQTLFYYLSVTSFGLLEGAWLAGAASFGQGRRCASLVNEGRVSPMKHFPFVVPAQRNISLWSTKRRPSPFGPLFQARIEKGILALAARPWVGLLPSAVSFLKWCFRRRQKLAAPNRQLWRTFNLLQHISPPERLLRFFFYSSASHIRTLFAPRIEIIVTDEKSALLTGKPHHFYSLLLPN